MDNKAEFELLRKRAADESKQRKKICIIGSAIIFVLILTILIVVNSNGRLSSYGTTRFNIAFSIFLAIPISMFLLFLFNGIVFLVHPARHSMATYRVAYKSYMIYRSLSEVFTNLKYYPNQGMPPAVVRTVMTTGDRYRSNDFMTATYKDINFTQADVHTEERHETRDSDGHTHTSYTTIFKGRFLIFDFKRDFSFRLQLVGKKFWGARLPRFIGENKFKKIETESHEFNKQFKIYAQDGFEAFYILDPSFIEKIQAIGTYYNNSIMFSFMDKKLIVAVDDGNDSFEAPHPAKLTDESAEKARIAKDIMTIVQFVDKLSLNRYMFEGKKKWKLLHGTSMASAPS